MTRDQTIRLAALANLIGLESSGIMENFEHFAAIVAAHEREECARVCEQYAAEAFNTSSTNAALELRNKIRERGKQCDG
jgi:histidinol dehydrogenase